MIDRTNARRLALFASVTFCASLTLGIAAAAADEASPRSTVSEVVVTARKRSERVQDVPATVNVIGAAQLEQTHVTQLTDIGAYVPGLQIDSQGTPGLTQISIRGIAPLSSGATVGTYIDEAPVGATSGTAQRSGAQSLDLLPYDVDRIEILEGPQGTLYGANSLGGLIKYVLTTPHLDQTEVRMGADAMGISGSGELGGGGRLMINTPLIDGKLGIIASGAIEQTPGFIDNSTTGQKDQNGVEQASLRFAMLYQPTNNLSIKLGALYQYIDAKGNSTVALNPTTLRPISGGLADNDALPNTFERQLFHYSAEINLDLHWAKLLSATSYSDDRDIQTIDYTPETGELFYLAGGAPADNVVRFPSNLDLQKYTQEFRLTSTNGQRLEWLVGAYITYEKGTDSQIIYDETATGAPVPGLYPALVAELPSIYREYAGFGSATYHFSDRFDLTAGVRYAENVQDFSQITSNSVLGPAADIPGHSSQGVATYNVSPSFHVTKDIMAYARVASGYQAGGPNEALPGVPPSVAASTLENYEIGLKSDFWERRATFNVAAFDLEWSDIQLNAVTQTGIDYTANGGAARSRGVEADGVVNPVHGLQLGAEATYTDATFTESAPDVGVLSGARIPYIPQWAGALTADYRRALNADWYAHVGVGLRLVGTRYSVGPASADQFKTPGYQALDANMDLSNARYTIRLYIKNLTDERAYLTDSAETNALTGQLMQVEGAIIQPRTIGLSLDVKL